MKIDVKGRRLSVTKNSSLAQNLPEVRCFRLENNPVFSKLRTDLMTHYESDTKSPLFSSLHFLLNEVVYTEDSEVQLHTLSKVGNWFNRKPKQPETPKVLPYRHKDVSPLKVSPVHSPSKKKTKIKFGESFKRPAESSSDSYQIDMMYICLLYTSDAADE